MSKKKAEDSREKYDNAAKIVFQERPMDVIQFATGYTSPTIEPLKTSLEIRRRREVDALAKIKIPSEKNPKRLVYVIAHLEFQTEPVSIMPYRMAEYKARLLRVYRMPIISTVIYFREKIGVEKDTGIFEQSYPQRFLAEYNVIQLWENNGEEALKNCRKPASGVGELTPGSLPFIPLMKPPEDCSREEWLSKCVSVADEITPQEHLPNLLFSMSVLSGLVISNTDTIETIIPEEIMKESAFYQHIVNKAKAEGLAAGLSEGRAEGRAEGKAEGKAEGLTEGLTEGLLFLIKNRFTKNRQEGSRIHEFTNDEASYGVESIINHQSSIINPFTSVPRNISTKIKSIRDKEILLNIQKLAIDAKTKREFVEEFNALNI